MFSIVQMAVLDSELCGRHASIRLLMDLVSWLAVWLAGWLLGWFAMCWQNGKLVTCWLAGMLAGWLACLLRFNCAHCSRFQSSEVRPSGAAVVGSEACELQLCGCHRHSRMAALQLQVALHDDALSVTTGVCKLRVGGCDMRSRIVI